VVRKNGNPMFNFGRQKSFPESRMEVDNCRACGVELDVEHLVVTECDDILCNACCMHHECDICTPSEHDSDSDYAPTATSCSEEEEEEEEEEDD